MSPAHRRVSSRVSTVLSSPEVLVALLSALDTVIYAESSLFPGTARIPSEARVPPSRARESTPVALSEWATIRTRCGQRVSHQSWTRSFVLLSFTDWSIAYTA
jgi:hypothetical protein